ncbi:MAG: hypothetical protein H7Z37_03725, partial [Pyrinomonadaceae bacterium]|nr:hypothetical protein [Pyrinomonadaceae bacterium]
SLNAPRLTVETASSILHICRLKADDFGFHPKDLQNDFEKTIFALKPEIGRVKNTLLEHDASFALMSGSGASVFAIFDNETARQKAFISLREREKSWRVSECETVSQTEYQQFLSTCWNLS